MVTPIWRLQGHHLCVEEADGAARRAAGIGVLFREIVVERAHLGDRRKAPAKGMDPIALLLDPPLKQRHQRIVVG